MYVHAHVNVHMIYMYIVCPVSEGSWLARLMAYYVFVLFSLSSVYGAAGRKVWDQVPSHRSACKGLHSLLSPEHHANHVSEHNSTN